MSALRESIQLRRELSEIQPALYQPGLALSLSNSSVVLLELDRGEEALEAAGEALQLLAPLLRDRPDALRGQAEYTLANYRAAAAAVGREPDPRLEAAVARTLAGIEREDR